MLSKRKKILNKNLRLKELFIMELDVMDAVFSPFWEQDTNAMNVMISTSVKSVYKQWNTIMTF